MEEEKQHAEMVERQQIPGICGFQRRIVLHTKGDNTEVSKTTANTKSHNTNDQKQLQNSKRTCTIEQEKHCKSSMQRKE